MNPPRAVEDRGSWTWIDLRLGPIAATVWAVSFASAWLEPVVLGLAGAAASAAAARAARGSRRAWSAVLLAALAGASVAAVCGAVRNWERGASPLRGPEVIGRTVEVLLEVDDDPRPLSGSAGAMVVSDATVTGLTGDRPVRGLDDAVLLFAPAEGWLGVQPGSTIRARAAVSQPRPGGFVVAVLSARGPPVDVGRQRAVHRVATVMRTGLSDSAERVLPPRSAGLLPGLVVGDTRGLDAVLEEEFRRAGLAHLTAVSGANVAIALSGVLWPLRRRAVDRRVQAAVAVVALVGFVVLARPTASVVRAAAMGGVTLWALAAGRPRAALPALGAATTVLLLLDPALSQDPGFALSVVATAAIVVLAPGWSRRLRDRGWPSLVADAVAVSAAAGMATAPVVAGLNGTVSLVSIPANLLAAPAVAPATVLGLLAAVVSAPLPVVADLLVRIAGWPVRWLVLVAERAAALPDAAVGWPAGVWGALGLTAALLCACWLLWRHRRLRALAVAVLAGLLLIGWPLRQVTSGWPPGDTLFVACDVGQGDALVVPTAPGAGVLVDAGPEVGPVDACLDRLGIEHLPLVVLSHLDADHVGGLAGALTGRRIGTVATGALSPADDRSDDLDRLLRTTGGTRAVLVPGDRHRVGSATVEVLAPEPSRATAAAEPNDLSLVARVTVRGVRVLMTGDLGAEAEQALVRAGTDLRADVLKVPHHGSGDADPAFLAASGARTALISLGADNTYGHPAPRLLRWLQQAGMRIYRTDRDGDLAVAGRSGDWGVAG